MKSLEFINKDLQDFEKALENYKKRKAINNEEVDEEYIKQMTKEIENYKQIKQYLEVLEILRKYMKLTRGVSYSGDFSEGVEYNLVHFEDIDDMVAKEDYNKVKQWLEENNG